MAKTYVPADYAQAVKHLYPDATPFDFVIKDDADGLGPYLDAWNLPGKPPNQQEYLDAIADIPGAELAAKKAAGKAILDRDEPNSNVNKAIVKLLVDELNAVREWDMAFKAAVAAATNLADLKVRVAALPDLPDRTNAQAIAAIKNILDQ